MCECASARRPSATSPARSISSGRQRASAAMIGRRTVAATCFTPSASSSDAIGKPASIRSTPKRVELPGKLDLLACPQRKAGRLLAVPQGRVEDGHSVTGHMHVCTALRLIVKSILMNLL